MDELKRAILTHSIINDKGLISYSHYPYDLAKKEYKEGNLQKYRVITINWTIAKQETDLCYHKNEYIFKLEELIIFIELNLEVAEDIISIERLT